MIEMTMPYLARQSLLVVLDVCNTIVNSSTIAVEHKPSKRIFIRFRYVETGHNGKQVERKEFI